MEMHNQTPPPDELREMLYYDDGELYWFPSFYRGRRTDKPLGSLDSDGYKRTRLKVDGVYRDYKLHRLIYWFETGDWVPMLDHKDRNRLNNRIENLQPSDPKANAHNQGIPKNNTTGFLGVRKQINNKYGFTITIEGKNHCFGGYIHPETAALARDIAARLLYGKQAYLNILDKEFIIKNPE
ncbi:HNH endonuclease [Salmonella enterica]|nr:HNH endonuclease [Salmonella enterica]